MMTPKAPIFATKFIRHCMTLALLLAFGAFAHSANGQGPDSVSNFRGKWTWAVYAKSRDELPPAYRSERLKDVPAAAIDLEITQQGNRLNGKYSASRRFLARVEDGGFDSTIKGNVARLELQSGFGGTVTVLLTRRGNTLHWKTIKFEGESYFPDDVYLQRLVSRRRRH
ncbi:MAG: hypothetical protein M3R68_05690 [Acidobacteriota bacterium]|nr:hypothetical protein [Acidobacteriota bacterium]